MAIAKGFCGFEAGDNAGLSAFSGEVRIVGSGRARTGDFHGEIYKASAASGSYVEMAGATAISGTTWRCRLRVYVLLEAYPSVANEPIAGFMGAAAIQFAVEMDTTGHVRARTGNTTSAYSAGALALGQWHKIEVLGAYADDPNPANPDMTCEVLVDGASVATVSRAMSGSQSILDPHVGGWSNNSSAIHFLFDDWVWLAENEAAPVAFPTQTRISRLDATAQGTAGDWTGDWRNVLDCPFESSIATDQTSAITGFSTTFAHKSAATLGIADIAAVKVYAVAKASVGAAHAILINGVEYSVTLGTTYPAGGSVPNATDWTAYSAAQFDALELGFRNKTGATVSLANLIGEVLHEGAPVDQNPGVESYKHKVGTFVGNGAFQAIGGIGFRPQVVIIKPLVAGAGTGGAYRAAKWGGTKSVTIGSGAGGPHGAAVLTLDADGFTLGPASAVNQNAITYTYIALQDGGAHPTGDFLRAGAYMGNGLDNRDIVISGLSWQPDVMIVAGSLAGAWRSKDMVGDSSAPFSNTAVGANYLQSFNADGFQVGTASLVNTDKAIYYWIAWRLGNQGLLDSGFKTGTYVGTGGAQSIAGLPFPPVLAWAKPATAVDTYQKSTGHAGANSQEWDSVTTITTSITSLDPLGFSVGSTLSVSGQTHYWVAFGESLIIPTMQPEVEPGLGESFGPLVWSEYATPPSNVVRVMAGVDLPDPATYYGGYKEPRMITPGVVVRALSDETGQYQGARFGVTYDDKDRYFRDLLDRYFTLANRRLVLRMIADEDRRQQARPRTVAVGIVRDYKAEKGLTFRLEAEDYFALFTGLGSNDVLLPRRLVTKADFPDAPAEAIGKPVPIVYGKVSDAFSAESPVTGVAVTEVESGLAQATNLVLTPSATGGALPAGKTIYVRVAARHAAGESEWTDPQSDVVPGGTGMKCVHDATIDSPTFFGAGGWIGGTIAKYRWCFATALKQVGGVWHESDPSNWGDVHGDVAPYIAANCLYRLRGTPDRVRLYLFNLNGFHPTLNPNPPIGVGGDSGPKVCRMIEADTVLPNSTVYSRKTGGRTDGDYAGDAAGAGYGPQNAWGDDGVEGTDDDLTHYLVCWADDDGEDYLSTPVGAVAGAGTTVGSIACSWTAAAGATSYRVYWTESADWTGTVYYADVAGTSYTITELVGATAVTETRLAVYMVTAIMPDGETAPSATVLFYQSSKALRHAYLTWIPKQGAMGYYVYRAMGGQDLVTDILSGKATAFKFDRRWTVPANPAGDVLMRAYFRDDFEDSDSVKVQGAPAPQGVFPLLYVGPAHDLSGGQWQRFLVAGHAVKNVVDIYQDGLRLEDRFYGDTLAVPGKTGWTALFGADQTEINGQRFTFVYACGSFGDAASAGGKPLSANVQGIETVGDGTGTLIEDLFEQYEHFLRNWVLRDYRTGLWATSGPTWGDTPYDVDVVDSASFASCKTIANGLVTGGFVGAFVIGVDPSDATPAGGVSVSTAFKQESVRTWIARLNQSADCYSGFSRHSQFVVRMINASQAGLSAAPRYTAELGINKDSFEIEEQPATIENQIDVRFKRNWAAATWAGAVRFEDKDAQARIDEVRPCRLDLWAVRTTGHATVIGQHRRERRKFPMRLVTWESDMGGLTADLGDLLRLTHPEGIGAQGWTDRPVFVIRHEFNPARFVVRFTALDVQWAFTPNIANVGFLPPLVDGLSDQGAAQAAACVMDGAALETTPVGCDFDLALLDAVCLNAGEDPCSPEALEDELPTGDLHTLGP